MIGERKVRSRNGSIPFRELEDYGLGLLKIKEWRAAEDDAGRPSSLADFYAAHGLCHPCHGSGTQMIGWSDPSTELELEEAARDNIEQLPVYDVAPDVAEAEWPSRNSRWPRRGARTRACRVGTYADAGLRPREEVSGTDPHIGGLDTAGTSAHATKPCISVAYSY